MSPMKPRGSSQVSALATLGGLCAIALAFPFAARAQQPGVIRGVVTDSSQAPLFGATVEVSGTRLRTTTDERGEFRLTGVRPGAIDISVRRLGFAPVRRRARLDASAGPAPFHIVLAWLPTTVRPVVVHGNRVEFVGRLGGYYERLHRRTNGVFIPRDELDRRSNRSLSQLLAATPGVNALHLRTGGSVRMRGRSCRPLVWLDGVPMPAGEVDLDAFAVSSIHGIEIYLGSTNAPMAYTTGQGRSSCGTILLWSRGMDTEHARTPARRSIDLEALAAANAVYTADQVEQQAELTEGQLEVTYPPPLFASGTVGSVVAEFVVDAEGRIEPGTFEILSETHPLFGEAVTAALSRARYIPAIKNGVAVRQLVHQPFTFARGAAQTSARAQD